MQKFCTTCGAVLPAGKRFCEHCGSAVLSDEIPLTPSATFPTDVHPDLVVAGGSRRPPGRSIILIAIILVIVVAVTIVLVLPRISTGTTHGQIPSAVTPEPSPEPVASVTVSPTIAASPSPTPDPFPDALRLKSVFPFGSGSVASEATVYRIWINDTYEWHSNKDNHYYVSDPAPGNKFLFVFVHLQNTGDTRVWFPPSSSVRVWYQGALYSEDPDHYKPDKAADEKSMPVAVKEVMFFPKLNGDEYAEDYGFSHGTELGYLYPGASNAVDGYIIYQVPRSLVPEEAYVTIPFNGKDTGIWRLG